MMIFWVVIGGFYLTGIVSAAVYTHRYCKPVKHDSVKHDPVKHESERHCRWATDA